LGSSGFIKKEAGVYKEINDVENNFQHCSHKVYPILYSKLPEPVARPGGTFLSSEAFAWEDGEAWSPSKNEQLKK
jgi:hypothetical protein